MNEYFGAAMTDPHLCHWGIKKNHKYVAKIGKGKDAKYFYSMLAYQAYLAGQKAKSLFTDENEYNSDESNYEKQRETVQKSDEWKNIVKSDNAEYRRRDSNGKVYYDYDEYLLDKKHPILDAAKDVAYGRKITVNKQDKKTVAAGLKDYGVMGKRAVETVLMVGAGLVSMKIKNQQGSYKDEKAEMRKKIKQGQQAVNDALELYSEYKGEVSTTVNNNRPPVRPEHVTSNGTGVHKREIEVAKAIMKAYNLPSETEAREYLAKHPELKEIYRAR